jgi:hypothetical protein
MSTNSITTFYKNLCLQIPLEGYIFGPINILGEPYIYTKPYYCILYKYVDALYTKPLETKPQAYPQLNIQKVYLDI